ncbi:MAG: PilN domain-containing protein [Caulobacteraceae bacterium]|nr:PilN domain-containing protein [Caulobacteraceae bacterium]
MSVQELLNAQVDFGSIAGYARRGLAWWAGELAAMLPAAWRDALSSRPRFWIQQRADGGWSLWRDGQRVESNDGGAPKKVGLIAPAGALLLREISAPPMSAGDVRRMIALDIDRLSPLAPELIHFDAEVIDRGDGGGLQTLLLGILPRAAGAQLVSRALADGYLPVRLAARVGAEAAPPRFDFLPVVLDELGEVRKGRTRLYWRLGVTALIAANLAVLVGRDMLGVARLRASVEAQGPAVAAVQNLRRRVSAETARRRDLASRWRRGEPLRLLDALTRAVPSGAWVQHLEWNGRSLHIVGFRREDVDVAAALLASGAFANLRVAVAEPTTGPTPIRPFDITADAKPGPQP